MSAQTGGSPIEAFRRSDRPRGHKGSSDAEGTIFAATERLLAEMPLHDLTVADIIREAGISRATFYFYFSSKFAVLTGLLANVMEEIFESVRPFVDRDPTDDPEVALRKSLDRATGVWKEHRFVLRATAQHWHAVPELRALWLGIVERFTQAIAAELDKERKAGAAPPGPPSRQLAATLLWSTEACLYVAGLDADDDLPSETALVDTLVRMWVGTLYGGSRAVDGKVPAKRKAASKSAATARRRRVA